MKKIILYLFLVVSFCAKAQQTIIYSQYTFNKAGLNPAASGTSINQKYNYVFGINRQWVGFKNSPQHNFANFSMTIRPPRSYRYWQNVGVYVDNEETGLSSHNGIYGTYAIHVLLRKHLVASFGVQAGIRTYYLSLNALDRSDPLVQQSNSRSMVYPDIIPGMRLSNRNFFMDLSARHVSVYSIQNYAGRQIGGPSKLNPSIFFTFGKYISLNDYFLLMPSVAINVAATHIPNVDLNTMLYYDTRMGFGLALRNVNFASVIYQLRIVKNIAVGLCYSTALNSMHYVAPNSFEIMIGITPSGMNLKPIGRISVERCPTLDF